MSDHVPDVDVTNSMKKVELDKFDEYIALDEENA